MRQHREPDTWSAAGTRRSFLQTAGATAAGALLTDWARSGTR
ncbi:MAG: hypothetical protein CO096_07860, partial [Armatimonadetes bacterium CG_4_9_14_3_um_filter_66_14]